jgi:ketosteroid isomerase-like protein
MTSDTETRQRRKDTAVRLMDAIASRDRDAVSSCFWDNIAWWAPKSAVELGVPRPVRGRTAVLDLVGMTSYRVGTTRWRTQHVLYDHGIVVVDTSLEAMTNAGKTYDNQYCFLLRFEGDLIVEVWEHADTAYAYARYRS